MSPSPNMTDSPVKSTAGRDTSTGWPESRTRYPDGSMAYSSSRPPTVARPTRPATSVQPRRASATRSGSSSGRSHSVGCSCMRRNAGSVAPRASMAATLTLIRPDGARAASCPMRGARRSEACAGDRHRQAHDELEADEPLARKEKRRQEVAVEPALVRGDRAHDQHARDDDGANLGGDANHRSRHGGGTDERHRCACSRRYSSSRA